MSKQIKVTPSDEAAFYLDFLLKKNHLDHLRNGPSIIITQMICDEIKKLKISDRPIWKDGEK